jgi:hypothetical protein
MGYYLLPRYGFNGALHNPLDLSKALSATLWLCGGSSTTLSSTRFSCFPFSAFFFPFIFYLFFFLARYSGSEVIESL